jgi:hypothetical protein
MAFAASLLRSEMRRHLFMNLGLVATCVTAGTVVTNERGLFVPIDFRMSDTARAFAAMFTQSELAPARKLSDVSMVSPLDAFEVTADSRDLRRRLMEHFDETGVGTDSFGQEPDANDPFQTSYVDNQTLTTVSGGEGSTVASNSVAGTGSGSGATTASNGATAASSSAASTAPASAASPTSVPSARSAQNTAAAPNTTPSAPINPNNLAVTGGAGDTVGAVPEPATWAMLITGFGFIGSILRSARRRKANGEAEAA